MIFSKGKSRILKKLTNKKENLLIIKDIENFSVL